MARKENQSKKENKDKKEESVRLKFTDWLYRTYEISYLPKYFFVNLDKVYKGTYKGLNKPVPVEDLWDMWQRKLPYLLKVYDRNKRMGKSFDGMARINYDMSIILSKYDGYLEWKEQQKQALIEEQSRKDNSIDYTKISTQPSVAVAEQKNTVMDISDILDEI